MTLKPIKLCLLIASVLLLGSCRKDIPPDKVETPVSISGGGVFITNEGNFLFGNSKVSYYDAATGTVVEDLYEPANGEPLGDICQSLYIFNGKIYIVVNNSGKVAVVNKSTFTTVATINGFTSPRFFLPVSNSKAYVSDLYADAIAVVDLTTNTISGSIPCQGWTENLVLAYGNAYITNAYSDKVYIVNTATDELTDSIQVGYGPNSIFEDKYGTLWVLCGGNQSNLSAGLYRIDPLTNVVTNSFVFPSVTDNPQKLCMNGSKDTLYYLNNAVFRLPVNATTLPATAVIEQGSAVFYGLGIDPITSQIYVTDAIDYVQKGLVSRYSPQGTLINSFLVGINPNGFYFN